MSLQDRPRLLEALVATTLEAGQEVWRHFQGQVEVHTKAGHKILLDDSTGAEKIEIRDKTGSNVVTIDSVTGEMRLESQLSLKIKSVEIEIAAQTNLKLSAGALVQIQGGLVKIN